MMAAENGGIRFIDEDRKVLLQKRERTQLMIALRDVNLNEAIDSSGRKLLHLSIEYKNVPLTGILIQRGVDIDPMDENGETPLIMALKYTRVRQVKLLLDANANFRNKDMKGNSALWSIFRLMPMLGAQLDIIKCTLMKLAQTCSNDDEIVQTLIDTRCSLDKVVYMNNPSLTRKMLEYGCDVNKKHFSNANNTALHVAVMLNYVDIIKVLLEYGAAVNIANRRGHIPLVYGIAHKFNQDPEIVEALMPQTYDWINTHIWNGTERNKVPLLLFIFTKGTKDTLRLFRKRYDIDFNARDMYGETPLHYLMTNSNEGILESFSDVEFDVDAQDSRVLTAPLHLAAMAGRPDFVRFLLDRGATVDKEDLLRQTPLLHTVMVNSNRDNNATNTSSAMVNFMDCVELLLLHGADPEKRVTGGTVLGWLISRGNFSVIKPVMAHLAVTQYLNTSEEQPARDAIYSHDQLKSYYELCEQQLEQSKSQFLHGTLTVHKVLTCREEEIAYCIRRHEMVDELINHEFQLESYYMKLSKKRLRGAVEINRRRMKVASLLCEIIGLSEDHLVIDEITSFLDKFDLRKVD